MDNNIEYLLTDEYVSYATEMIEIQKTYKEKSDAIKKLYDQWKVDKSELEKAVKEKTAAWEETKKTLKGSK